MRVVYVCAPLAGNIEANVKHVVKAVDRLVLEYRSNEYKEMPMFLVPHFALHGITFNMEGETDRKWGMECCIEMVGMAQEMVVIGDHITAGMAEEMKRAFRMGIKVTRRSDL